MAKSDAKFGFLVLELFVELRFFLEDVGQKVGMLGEVGQLFGHFFTQKSRVFLLAVVLLEYFILIFKRFFLFFYKTLVRNNFSLETQILNYQKSVKMFENYLISAALLNPFGEFLDGSRKSSWWVVRHG